MIFHHRLLSPLHTVVYALQNEACHGLAIGEPRYELATSSVANLIGACGDKIARRQGDIRAVHGLVRAPELGLAVAD